MLLRPVFDPRPVHVCGVERVEGGLQEKGGQGAGFVVTEKIATLAAASQKPLVAPRQSGELRDKVKVMERRKVLLVEDLVVAPDFLFFVIRPLEKIDHFGHELAVQVAGGGQFHAILPVQGPQHQTGVPGNQTSLQSLRGNIFVDPDRTVSAKTMGEEFIHRVTRQQRPQRPDITEPTVQRDAALDLVSGHEKATRSVGHVVPLNSGSIS